MKGVSLVEQYLIGILLLVTILLLFVNVVMRYVFSANITWAEEFSRYAIVWITFIGTSVCVYIGGHITVDSIHGILSEKNNRILAIVIYVVSIVFALALTWFSIKLTVNSIRTKQTMPGMGIQMAWAYLAMPVGSILLAIRYFNELIEEIAKGGEKQW